MDVDFLTDPLGRSITLAPARGLRDKRLGVPLQGWQQYESELRAELVEFNEHTREPGASRHAPRN